MCPGTPSPGTCSSVTESVAAAESGQVFNQQTSSLFLLTQLDHIFPASLVIVFGHMTQFWVSQRGKSDLYDTSRLRGLGDVPSTDLLSSLIYWLETEDMVEGYMTMNDTTARQKELRFLSDCVEQSFASLELPWSVRGCWRYSFLM